MQNLYSRKKANNSMKNNTRIINNVSNNRYCLALFVYNANFTIV